MPRSRRLILSILAVVVIAGTAYTVARAKRDFWDFEVYRTAAVRALDTQPLYRAEDGHYQFKYWPAFAFAMAPFGLVDAEIGKVIWYALSLATIALFLRQSIRLLPERRSTQRFLAWWVVILTAKFLVKELVNGQTNALLGVLVMLALVAIEERRSVTAGLLIGAAAFVKPYALIFVPWLAVTGGIPAVAAGIGVIAGGLAAPALTYGWQGNLDLLAAWYSTVAGTTPANLLFPENISFAAMWAKWIGPGSTASWLTGASALGAVGAATVVLRRRRSVPRPAFLEVGFLLLLVPLLSPQGWDYVLLIATPVFVCLVDRFRGDSFEWRIVTATGFALTSFTVFDLLGRQLYLSLMAGSVVSLGALLLAASVFRLRVRRLA